MVEHSVYFLTVTGVRDSSSFEIYSSKPITGASNPNSDMMESSTGFLCKMMNYELWALPTICPWKNPDMQITSIWKRKCLHIYSSTHTFCSSSRELHLYWSIQFCFFPYHFQVLGFQAYRKHLKALCTEENMSDGTNNTSAILLSQLLTFLRRKRLASTHN